jgi:hypothetical protein
MASTSLVSLDSFHKNFHFYACLEPPLPKAQFDRRLHVATSFVGAIPHHPIIRAWAKKIKNLARSDKHVEASIASAAKNLKTRGWLTYLLFGSSVDQKLKSEEFINIVFPPTYAFPLSPTALRHSEKKKQSKTFFLAQILNKLGLKRAPPFSEIQPETVAIDTKGGTWADQKQIAIVVSK